MAIAPRELKDRLNGVVAFAPTAFAADGSLDEKALAVGLEYLVSEGVAAVAVCGGVGEFYALTPDEFKACIQTAVDVVGHAVPVIAGVGHSTMLAAGLAKTAADCGADGLLVHPFYFVSPTLEGAVAHYEHLAAASGLGMIVYSTGSTKYTSAQFERLAEIEAVVGVKDETRDLENFKACVEQLGSRFRWINGMAEPECLAYVQAGADAMTSGYANLSPTFSSDVWQAATSGDLEALDQHLSRVAPLFALRDRFPGQNTALIKAGLEFLGRPMGDVRLPLLPFPLAAREELGTALQAAGF